jgi:hypothetical protein
VNLLRTLKDRADRLLVAPWFIPTLSVIAVAALCLSTYSVVRLALDAKTREDLRVEADVEGCERGNVLRSQTAGIGRAGGLLVDGVVDEVAEFAQLDAGEKDELDERLAHLFAEYSAEVEAIETVNCRAVTPGSQPGGNP